MRGVGRDVAQFGDDIGWLRLRLSEFLECREADAGVAQHGNGPLANACVGDVGRECEGTAGHGSKLVRSGRARPSCGPRAARPSTRAQYLPVILLLG